MKQRNIESVKEKERKEAVKGTIIRVVFQLLWVAVLLWLRHLNAEGWLRNLLLILAVLDLFTIPFTLVVLKQRLREIERGELDEARKY